VNSVDSLTPPSSNGSTNHYQFHVNPEEMDDEIHDRSPIPFHRRFVSEILQKELFETLLKKETNEDDDEDDEIKNYILDSDGNESDTYLDDDNATLVPGSPDSNDQELNQGRRSSVTEFWDHYLVDRKVDFSQDLISMNESVTSNVSTAQKILINSSPVSVQCIKKKIPTPTSPPSRRPPPPPIQSSRSKIPVPPPNPLLRLKIPCVFPRKAAVIPAPPVNPLFHCKINIIPSPPPNPLLPLLKASVIPVAPVNPLENVNSCIPTPPPNPMLIPIAPPNPMLIPTPPPNPMIPAPPPNPMLIPIAPPNPMLIPIPPPNPMLMNQRKSHCKSSFSNSLIITVTSPDMEEIMITPLKSPSDLENEGLTDMVGSDVMPLLKQDEKLNVSTNVDMVLLSPTDSDGFVIVDEMDL